MAEKFRGIIKEFFKKLFKSKPCSCCCTQPNLTDKISTAALALNEADEKTIRALDERIVVGKILNIHAHSDPKITKVQVTECDLGGEKAQILCGGSNIKEGQIVPIARLGTKLSDDFEIGERDIRGEVSRGMICARSELGLSPANEDKGQIWELPKSMENFLGKSLNSILD